MHNNGFAYLQFYHHDKVIHFQQRENSKILTFLVVSTFLCASNTFPLTEMMVEWLQALNDRERYAQSFIGKIR